MIFGLSMGGFVVLSAVPLLGVLGLLQCFGFWLLFPAVLF